MRIHHFFSDVAAFSVLLTRLVVGGASHGGGQATRRARRRGERKGWRLLPLGPTREE